jgi:zinc protease
MPGEELPLALFIEAARMARPLDGLDEAAFAAERSVVQNERRQRVDNVPYGNLDDLALYLLFHEHPYRTPTVGFAADLARATLADARSFATTFYRPNNATLVVTGGFDAKRATALIKELFGAIPAAALPMPDRLPLPKRSGKDEVYRVLETGVDAPAIAIAWLVPPAGTRGWHEMVLAAQLFGPETKHTLGDSVRKLEADVVSLNAVSALLIHIELAPGAGVSAALARVDEELDTFAGTSADLRLGAAKSHIIAQQTLNLEQLDGRAKALQTYVARYGHPDSVQYELHEFSDVTRSSLADAVSSFRKTRVVVEARPDPSAPKAGRWP